MGHGTKSKNHSNTYSFSSSGYSSQSLSEIDHNNNNNNNSKITSSNYTINTDYHVRTSTPTSHDYYQNDIISQQQPATTTGTIYTIDTLDNNKNETPSRFKKFEEGDEDEEKGLIHEIFSFIFKLFTCFNLFKKNKNSDDNRSTRSTSPDNSIYDNFNLDLHKYAQEEIAKKRTQNNYYEYRPAIYNKSNNRSKIIIHQQQISTISPHYNQNIQISPELIIETNYCHNPYYCNNNTRNSTFINNIPSINEHEIIKPYLSASSISSIELSTNNNKLRCYSVDSIIKQKNKFNQTAPKTQNCYYKTSSIDSVIPTSVSTSLSSLETAISCSSSVSQQPKRQQQQQQQYNLKYISPIVDYNSSKNRKNYNYQQKCLDSNNYYDKAPNVMIQLEKMSLKRSSNRYKQHNSLNYNLFQEDRQLSLLNPIYDDWICDKEVESYFENPVYFDCYDNQAESSNVYQQNFYYPKNKQINNHFKSESYC